MANEFDVDGFALNDIPWRDAPVKAPPPMVEMPGFFAGCTSDSEAIIWLIEELKKPFSVEQHGIDEMYRRVSLSLTFILAKLGDMTP